MAKSSAPKTSAELLELLSKSGLLSAPQQAAAAQFASQPDIKESARQLVREKLLTSWQAGQLLAGQFVLRLGDYALQSEAGSWDLGRAFVAQSVTSPQPDPLLLLLVANRFVQDEPAWQAAVSEIQAAGRLASTHLVPFREVGRAAQRSFLILPAARSDLRQLLTRFGAPSPDQVARIIQQAAEGLAVLHGAGLSHGCLEPQRIELDGQGTVQLRELGLARLASLRQPPSPPDVKTEEPDRFAPPADTPPFRGDLYALGRIGQFLLEAPSPAINPRDESDAPPPWWHDALPSAESLERLRAILHRLAVLDSETAPRDAQTAAQWLREWRESLSESAPQAAGPVEQPVAPDAAVDGPDGPSADSLVSGSAGATSSSAPTEPRPVVIDTQRRRRPTAEGSALPRPRQRGLLVLTTSLLAVTLLAIGGLWGWQHYRGGDTATAAAAARPSEEARARLMAAGLKTGEEQAAAAEFPASDELQFPTADAFGATEEAQPASGAAAKTASGPAELPAAQPAAAEALAASASIPAAPADSVPAAVVPENSPSPHPADVAMALGSEPSAAASPEPSAAAAPLTQDPTATPEPAAVPAAAPGVSNEAAAAMMATLPGAVQLPEMTSSDGPVGLMPLVLGDSAILTLQLEGGERVGRGGAALKLENAAGGTAERAWEVFVLDEAAGRTPVAQFEWTGQQLQFQWLDKASATPLAGQLANCALNLAVGTAQRDVGLRVPIVVDPLPLDLVRGLTTGKWDIPNAPDASDCRLEILGLAGQPHPLLRIPNDSIPVSGSQWLLVGETPTTALFGVHLDSQFRRQLELSVTTTLRPDEKLLDKTTPPRAVKQFVGQRENRITRSNLERWTKATTAQLEQATGSVALLTRQSQSGQLDAVQQQEVARNLNLANQDLQRAQAQSEQLQKILTLSDPQQTPALLLRVVFETEGSQVELLRTRQP